MLYVIHCIDKANALPTRLAHYDAHKAFLADTQAFGVKIVTSGPLVGEDGATMIGSLLIVEAESRDSVMRFNQADPFFKAGIWDLISINGFIRRQG